MRGAAVQKTVAMQRPFAVEINKLPRRLRYKQAAP